MRSNAPDWTEAEKKTLTQQWGRGLTARQIAIGLQRSRSAVCGMARRLNLPTRQHQEHKTADERRHTNGKRVHRGMGLLSASDPVAPSFKYALGPAWEPLPGVTPVPLMDLEASMCRWPLGEEKPFLFCGARTNGSSYCAHHAALSAGDGSSMERAAIKFAIDANKEEWRRSEEARRRQWEPHPKREAA